MNKIACCLLLVLSSMTCPAQVPSDESIRTLFRVMKAEALMDTVYANLEPAMRQGMQRAAAGQTLNDQQKLLLDRAPQKLAEVMRSELSWAKMEPMQIAVYRESFQQPEIDALIKFYSSPTGQMFVNKMPLVTQRAMAATQSYIQDAMPRIKAAMDELVREAKAAK